MPRNMSFMLTTEQMYKRQKTVTRRLGWWHIKPGDVVQAVEKCQGLKKGEQVKKICLIRILDTKAQELFLINFEEQGTAREGFPAMRPHEFIDMFCRSHKGCRPKSIVNRIEFEFL